MRVRVWLRSVAVAVVTFVARLVVVWWFVVVMLLVVVERLVAVVVVVVVDEIATWDCGGLPMVDYHCAVTWVVLYCYCHTTSRPQVSLVVRDVVRLVT